MSNLVQKRVVFITGSRRWTEYEPIRAAITGADFVVHGAAFGADTIANLIATDLGIDTLPIPANWRVLGRAAGALRNTWMVTLALFLRRLGCDVVCFAFPMSDSVGTWDCVRKMIKAGITTHVSGKQ